MHQGQDDTNATDDSEGTGATWLDLYDFRVRVARLYTERDAATLVGADAVTAWARWREGKDALYAQHPQTPLSAADRVDFAGLDYFDYDPAYAVEASLEPITMASETPDLPASGPLSARFPLAGRLRFRLREVACTLAVYWIDVYGGGLFCPVRDTTSGRETYGGGRYLCDTVKGSTFVRLDRDEHGEGAPLGGYAGGRVVLDFNYLYNPSCAYDPRWACPLAPAENVLPLALSAGERAYQHG